MICLLIVMLTLTVGSGMESINCTFSTNSLVEAIKSTTKIIQIDLDLRSSEQLTPIQSPNATSFSPSRWFIVRGERTNRLLLLFYFYYGYFEPYIIVPRENINMPMSTTCFQNITSDESVVMIRKNLLYMTDSAGRDTAFKENEVCSMFIKESGGFGILIFRCCKSVEKDITCYDVEEDSWIWTLRVFVMTFSILLFLYFPKFIPVNLGPKTFKFRPRNKLEMSILKTKEQSTYKSKLIIPVATMKHMSTFCDHLQNLQTGIIFNTEVQSIDLLIQRGQIISETDKAVSFRQLLYDLFIRFKIRHVDIFQVCCSASIFGNKFDNNNIVPWHRCLRRVRTIIIYMCILLPALPLMFILCLPNTNIINLGMAIRSRGLLEAHSFHLGPFVGQILTGFVFVVYLLHVIMVLSMDSFQNELFEVIGIYEKDTTKVVTEKGHVTRALMSLFTKYGLLAVPVLPILIMLSPILIILYVVVTAPVIKILIRQFTKLCGFHKLSSMMGSKCGPKLSLFLFISLLSVFVILTIGINFLLHCLCVIIVNVLINWYFAMSLISIVVLIVVYVRDSAKRLEGQYNNYFKAIFKEIMAFKTDQITLEANKSVLNQSAMAFQVTEQDVMDVEIQLNGTKINPFKWDIKHDCLRFKTSGVVLFLDKRDVPYIPKRLFEEMTYMDCPGCPGPLINSLCQSFKDLGGIGIFLLFLFLLVMSYGEALSVTPTTRFFATLATGLVPLLLRSFFFSGGNTSSLNTTTLRFKNHFLHTLLTFEKRWKVSDCQISVLEEPFAFSLWKKASRDTVETKSEEVDIIIDTSFKSSNGDGSCCCSPIKVEDV
ncbi:hypothetical protein LOTGIDRAFT_155319 [Lottia gigantea]|uniref:Uncharacterized protein n=1 Tax=Lottia gigantea TaxID=225164 RepID=V3ZIG8_LOTGI|nr:hypothetical protein LOTGIDRAFT_155319 [Lottia gigantea]ESO84007.1 hypothetical protein LOTGIDRAFT_155319 [Lottia gigantea]